MKKLMTILSAGVIATACTTASAADFAGVDIHGFASQGYVTGTEENNFLVSNSGKGSFNFNEFGVNFSKQISPELRLGMQFFAQDRGSYGKDNITLDWAYGDYRYNDFLGARVGRIKIPLGLYGDTRDTDSLRTFILLPQPIYVDALRDVTIAVNGAELYGTVPLGPVGALSYRGQIGTMSPSTDDGTSLRIGSSFTSALSAVPGLTTVKIDEIGVDTSFVHALEWKTPLNGLRLSTTGIHTAIDGSATSNAAAPAGAPAAAIAAAAAYKNIQWKIDNYHSYIFSGEYTWKDLALAAEYNKIDSDQIVNGQNTPTKSDSWYVSATYRLTDWVEAGAYYTERYANRNDRDGSEYAAKNIAKGLPAHNQYHKDIALSLRFDPIKDVVLKVEGHIIDGTALLDASEFKTAKKESYLLASKVTISF